MSWQPDTPFEKKSVPITKVELEGKLVLYEWPPLRRFVETVRDGDVLTNEVEGNNNRKICRYVGRSPCGLVYSLIYSSMMA
jgi:hypothetical protein